MNFVYGSVFVFSINMSAFQNNLMPIIYLNRKCVVLYDLQRGLDSIQGFLLLILCERDDTYRSGAFCRQHENSNLVHVDDAVENGFLKDRMRLFKDFYWWVGIKDEDIEGVWKWFDTDDFATFTDFKPNDGGDHNTEDCATFARIIDCQWVDTPCANSLGALCETRGHEEASISG
ncbi:hypothetical protein DPMN_142364 [Dreissena polymorpha]|uniref:C-type lectin domain-containing protein n=1 Tax=Dreissena polymorpha TaxID=45954 RepID=A0A9D4GB60_DREPO|nr:hypothetical protein DPMN_142364 [Dreissena polymorpha]